jgi:hypothetical protein
VVIRDTATTSSDADLVASTRTQLRIRDDMKDAADMINNIEVMRKTVADERQTDAANPEVMAALMRLDGQMLDVEHHFLSRSDMESDDKYFIETGRIYMSLVWLAGEVGSGAGDVAGGADYRPTAQALATLSDIEKQLAVARTSYSNLVHHDLLAFNTAMAGRVPVISVTGPAGR